jgi:hypothetical protein
MTNNEVPKQVLAPTLSSPPLEPTISPIHPFTPTPQPLPSPAQTVETPQTFPPTPSPDAPIDEMTLFMEESISRYREILQKERELFNEGKTLHIPKVFEEFMGKEIKIRRERYDIPEPVIAKTVEQEPTREVSVLPSDSISKPIVEPDTRGSVQQVVSPAASVKEAQVLLLQHSQQHYLKLPLTWAVHSAPRRQHLHPHLHLHLHHPRLLPRNFKHLGLQWLQSQRSDRQ